MVGGKKQMDKINIKLGHHKVAQVEEFCYLGSRITSNGRSKKDIASRIAQVKKAFCQKRCLLAAKNTSLEIRKHFIKTYVWSMLLYGCEAWTITATKQGRLEAMEMWCYRRMMNVKWTERITNKEVLRRVGEKRNIMNTLRRRRSRCIGHILRHSSLLKTVLEGKICGRSYSGGPRIEQIMKGVKTKIYVGMKRLADNREDWRAATD
jgi:hypothetical protein